MTYTAVIIDENGVDQGRAEVSGARNDVQARDLARQSGMKWLAGNSAKRATVQISHGGRGLNVEVCV